MDEVLAEDAPPPNQRKKRIPKACGACRVSKVKCDEQRPCSRCKALRRVCEFVERPRDPYEDKIDHLQHEVESLKARLQQTLTAQPASTETIVIARLQDTTAASPSPDTNCALLNLAHLATQSQTIPQPRPPKRKRSHYELGTLSAPDFIQTGIISSADASAYFATFFSGCDQFVPVFDPTHDTMDSVRRRSPLLFGTICTIGCRVLQRSDSHHSRVLNFHTQRMLNAAVSTPPGSATSSLETIQALLVRACYASERSLLLAVALRIALELGLPDAFDTASARFVLRGRGAERPSAATEQGSASTDDEHTLMRKTRTWLHLVNMSHIMHVDAGDLPTVRFRGAASRCRILLSSTFSTDADLHLLPQVELNAIRARISTSLSQLRGGGGSGADDNDLLDAVRSARIDIDVWFDSWSLILQQHAGRLPWLAPNLAVQRCWADSMAMCGAVRCSGVEDVTAMSATQREILLMARDSLLQNLDIILEEPRMYLANLRYAADFVWAKNAFCLLLLLKLSMLLPDGGGGKGDGDEQRRSRHDLVKKSRDLLAELAKSANTTGSGTSTPGHAHGSNTSTLYLHLVKMSIEKYNQALDAEAGGAGDTPASAATHRTGTTGAGGHTELESFVPEQFVFEWDFPGLTLFSSPTTEATWFDDFILAGSLEGGEDMYGGLGWTSVDFSI